MKKSVIFLLCLVFFTPVLALGQFATPSVGTLDSIGVDVDGGAMDNWLYPAYLREGTNVTFTVTGDTLTIAGSAGAGTADSTYFNDGATQYGPFINDMYKIKEGVGIDIVRDDSTTYDVFNIGATLGTSVDLTSEVTGTLPEANGGTGDTDLDDMVGGTAITITDGANTIIGGNATVAVTAGGIGAAQIGTDGVSADELNATGVESELEAVLDLQDLQGAVTDGQVPDSIAITLADGSVTYGKMQTNYADSLGNLYQNETIAGNWVNIANPWADNEIATSGNWNTAYGWGDHSGQGYVDTAELHDSCDVLRAEMGDDAKADTAGDGSNIVDLGSPFVIQEGTNITLTVDNDTLTIAGEAGGGGSNADSIKSIPIQDTTGNIGDIHGLTFDDSKDTLVWTEFWGTPETAPTDNYLLKIDTDPDPDTFYWAADETGAAGTADSMQVDTSGAGGYASIYATGGYAFTFREGTGIDYTANTDTVYMAATLGANIAWGELQSAVQETIQARLSLAGGQMTGNITMAGAETVDGKDVSTLTDIGQTIESGEITDQTIVKDDIDTTSGFVFGSAYKITSGQADSAFMTKGYMDGAFLTGNESITLSGDATGSGATAITVTVVDDLHDHVYSNIDATTSANWATRVSDETGTGVLVFGTSPTFTTGITVTGTITSSDTLTKSFVIQAPDTDHDFPFWMTPKAITLIACNGVCIAGTNIVGCLMEYDNDAANPAVCNSSDWTFTTGEERTTSLSNASIDAGDYLGWKTTSVSGEVSFLTITIEYTQP